MGMSKVIVYTKFCLECFYENEIKTLKQFTFQEQAKLIIKRTAYRPSLHAKAVKIYGSDKYSAFVQYGEIIIDIPDFANFCKNKMIKRGKRKGRENDLSALQPTKRDHRKTSILGSSIEDKDES